MSVWQHYVGIVFVLLAARLIWTVQQLNVPLSLKAKGEQEEEDFTVTLEFGRSASRAVGVLVVGFAAYFVMAYFFPNAVSATWRWLIGIGVVLLAAWQGATAVALVWDDARRQVRELTRKHGRWMSFWKLAGVIFRTDFQLAVAGAFVCFGAWLASWH